MTSRPHDVKDLSLAGAGQLRIDGGELSMPVLRRVRERFQREQPLRGTRIDELTPRPQEYLASRTQGT
jgi:adenosylhomocysteinase